MSPRAAGSAADDRPASSTETAVLAAASTPAARMPAPRRGEQHGGGHHRGDPGDHRGQHRHRDPDHEILGLLGVTDQPGQQVAAVPPGQPGRDQVLQPAVQPPAQPGLHPEPECRGWPAARRSGSVPRSSENSWIAPMAMDSSRIGGRRRGRQQQPAPGGQQPERAELAGQPDPHRRLAPAARSPALAQLHPSLPERHRLRVVRGDDHGWGRPGSGRVRPPAAAPRPVKSGRRLVQQPQPRNGTGQTPGHGQPPSLAQAERRVQPAQRRAQCRSAGAWTCCRGLRVRGCWPARKTSRDPGHGG